MKKFWRSNSRRDGREENRASDQGRPRQATAVARTAGIGPALGHASYRRAGMALSGPAVANLCRSRPSKKIKVKSSKESDTDLGHDLDLHDRQQLRPPCHGHRRPRMGPASLPGAARGMPSPSRGARVAICRKLAKSMISQSTWRNL